MTLKEKIENKYKKAKKPIDEDVYTGFQLGVFEILKWVLSEYNKISCDNCKYYFFYKKWQCDLKSHYFQYKKNEENKVYCNNFEEKE